MFVFLNGRFVPEQQAMVSVFDRGFLYGDGLFETMLVAGGEPFRWDQHLERLRRGAEFLKLRIPFPAEALQAFARELIAKNEMPRALLRLNLSRGVGPRGYSPRGADEPTLVMSLHPAPAAGSAPTGWKLITSSFRLPAGESLALFKTCNKLPQILARADADAQGADEALLLNTDGFVVEASAGNLFWVEGGARVCTPPLTGGILPGVTRGVVLEICAKLGLTACEQHITPSELKRAGGIFLSLSSFGVVGAHSLDGAVLGRSPLVENIQAAYEQCVLAETG